MRYFSQELESIIKEPRRAFSESIDIGVLGIPFIVRMISDN